MSRQSKDCQFCGEEILAVAVKCKHCGSALDEFPMQGKSTKKKSSILSYIFWGLIGVILLGALLNENPDTTNLSDQTFSNPDNEEERATVEVSNGLWGLEFGMSPEVAGRVTNDTIRCAAIRDESASCRLLENNSTVFLTFSDQQIDPQNCCIGQGGELSRVHMTMGQYTRASARELLDELNERYDQIFEPTASERSQRTIGEGSIIYFFENRQIPDRPKYVYLEISRAYFDLFDNLREDMDLNYVSESVGEQMLLERESNTPTGL